MAKKVGLKKFAGVYYSESTVKRWRERPDRCYWVRFKDAFGKEHWERCGWASEGWTPESAQRRRYELLEDDRTGKYKPKKERKAETLSFKELMEKHYLPWADANKKRARDDRSLYRNWLSFLATKTLKEIAPLDLERLKKTMRDAGKSEATVKHALCLVRQAFNKAILWGLWKGTNPCLGVDFPKVNNARQRFLSQDEAILLLEALNRRSPQVALIAGFALYGGVRLSEAFGLRWSNIDMLNGIIFTQDTKNTESRPIFITEPIRKIIEAIPPGAPDEFIFKTKLGQPITWLSKTFRKVVDELKLNEGIDDRREKVCFHTLRHTFGSWSVMAGTPLYMVGKSMGHKTLEMTKRYAHLALDSQRTAFEAVAKMQNQQIKKVEIE